MDPQTVQAAWALFQSHNYLGFAILVIGWLVTLLSPSSKFKLTIPTIYGRDPKPLIAAVLGMAYGVLVAHKGGEAWLPSVQHGLMTGLLTMGLFDLVVKFVFNGNAPAFMNALAMVFPKPTVEEAKAVIATDKALDAVNAAIDASSKATTEPPKADDKKPDV